MHVVLQVPTPTGVSDLHRVQQLLRRAFTASLPPLCQTPRMWASGVNEQAAEELRPVLVDHGVPKELAQSRAQAAVKAIGGSQILGALASKIPWKQLKTLGNQVKFQFLLPAELQDKIKQSAGHATVGRPKGAKKSKKITPADREVHLDPTKLSIPDCFFAAGGKSLSQIPLSAVGPLAEGVALVTQLEASPYLQQGQAVSNHPLALLIVQPELPLQTTLAHSQVTVPCKCLANNEPVLLEGILCQIGSGFVEKVQTMSQIAVDVVNVGALKLVVYRDEIEGTWEAFLDGPLRYIVAKIPLLRFCPQPNCQCAHWHNPDRLATKEVIVDVWRRQFLQINFRPESAPQASIYSVCIRLPECLVQPILAVSGVAGIYPEPRTLDARSVHPDYAMVWLPKMSRTQLNHLKQTTPAALGIGRVGERFGLRVLSTDAAAVHALLKPEAVFLPSGPRHEFLTGPFPFGSDRTSLIRAFKALKWEARPVQPMSSVDSRGSMWLVQANQEPPDTILTMAHGDVVVTRYRPSKEPKDQKPRPIASAATLALCGGQAPDTKDPWINSDFWGGYQATTSRNHVVPEASEGLRQLETTLENRLKKAVMESIPAQPVPMERDDVPDRVCHLESQLSQLLGKHSQLEAQACLRSNGLRVVAGDFNNSEFDIPAFQILRDAGFKDLQSLAAERWGLDVQNTCKCATRVDYCFISPELQVLLHKVQVDQTVWPDHAVLAGFFHGGVRDVPRFVWRQPQPLQWPAYEVDTVSDIAEGHATAVYTQIWQKAESAAASVSKIPLRKASGSDTGSTKGVWQGSRTPSTSP
eukprot:s309_g10.t1